MKLVFRQVGDVAGQRGRVMMHGLPGQNPSHVRPPFAIDGRVGIALFVRMLMMNAVCGHPENWSAFQRQSCAHGQTIFHPLGRSVSAMGEQAVIAHTDAQTSRNPPKEHGNEQRLPGEKELLTAKDAKNCRKDRKGNHDATPTPLSLLLRPTSRAGSAWQRSRGFHGHLRWPFRRFLQLFPGLAAWLELPLPLQEPTEYLCA